MNIVYIKIKQVAKVRDVPAFAVDADVYRATWPTYIPSEQQDEVADAVTITESRARDGYQLCVGVGTGRLYADVSIDQLEAIAETFVQQFLRGELDDEAL